MVAANEALEVVETIDDDDLEFDLPTGPDEHSFLALHGRYEELCEAAKRQLHEMLRGA